MRFAPWLVCVWLGAATSALAQEPEPQPDPESAFAPATTPDPGSMLPGGPVKPLVLGYCDKCHGLAWIERAEDSGELSDYHLLPAARADLLRRAGRCSEAQTHYRRALDLAQNPAERLYLERRLREVAAAS